MTTTEIQTYQDLKEALKARRKALGLSQAALGCEADLQDGYVGKIEADIRRLGPLSLPMMLAALDVELIAEPIEGG